MWALCHIRIPGCGCGKALACLLFTHPPMDMVLRTTVERSIKSGPNQGQGLQSSSSVADLPLPLRTIPSSHLIKMKFIAALALTAISVSTTTLAARLSIKMPNGPVKPDSYIVYVVLLIGYSI